MMTQPPTAVKQPARRPSPPPTADPHLQVMQQVLAELQEMRQVMEAVKKLMAVQIAEAASSGEFPAVSLSATVNDGKIYWKVKGGPFTKHGAMIWPEVLEAAGFTDLDPFHRYDLTGWTAVYRAQNEDGTGIKVTELQPPVTKPKVATPTPPPPKSAPPKTPPAPEPATAAAPADGKDWYAEALASDDELFFDTALQRHLVRYFTAVDALTAARRTICGSWQPEKAKATADAMITYVEEIERMKSEPGPVRGKEAIASARGIFNRGGK